jgi:hypothetical protein
VATTLPMLTELVADGEFAAGGVDTGYLARFREPEQTYVRDKKVDLSATSG